MRTINDIVPPSRRREAEPRVNESSPREPLRLSEQVPQFPKKTLVATLLVITLSLSALFYFSTSKVEITPNTVSAAVQSSFTATKSSGDLPYEIITAQKIASQGVKSSGSKAVHSFASGPITIYNTQSKSQKLIANTRFATAAGLIFRIHEAVVIPAGSVSKPGSIRATVTADKAGDSYNVEPTSFTVPGFLGTPLATEVYARSSASMTGGASGTVPVVDTTLEMQARSALTNALTTELTASLKTQIPPGYILLSGASDTTFQDLASTPSPTTGMVDVKIQGTITAVVFPNSALAKAVALSTVGLNYQNEPLSLLSISNLQLAPTVAPDVDMTSFDFTLAGTASLVYTVDATRIAAAVAGKTRSAAEVALTNYPEVKRAVIILRPFWRQTFPQDPSTITITVGNP